MSQTADNLLRSATEDVSDIFVDKNGEMTLGKLYRWLLTVEDRVSMSLPAYLKRAVIESRTFITREAAIEECINDLLYCINVIYAGWCMTALSMNQMCNGSKIRDIMNTVATESLSRSINQPHIFLDEKFRDLNAFSTIPTPFRKLDTSSIIPEADTSDISGETDWGVGGTAGSKPIEFSKDYRLCSGIIIDISLALGDNRSRKTITVPMAVRLNPTIISSDAAKQFFASNFKQDLWMRWFKVKTGEISFWKDFLFEMDLMREKADAIKNDRTGTVKEMYDAKQSALSSWLLKLIGWRADRQNIASMIHIFTKPQFDDYCRTTHCNFNSESDRLKYFRSTLSMIVAVIDNSYQTVDMYIAGTGSKARYQFSQLQNYTKPNQYDLTAVMRAFSNSAAPRF